MIMRNHVANFVSMAGLALGLSLPGARLLAAGDSTFSFGPPLRPNIVFVYKVTERVKLVNALAGSTDRDSSVRTVTYFISERQQPSETISGQLEIRANVDSMRIEYQGLDGDVNFDTQKFPSDKLVRHREVLGPSVVVNRMATVTLSAYGEVLKVESPALHDLQKDLNEPSLDAFTKDRVRAVISDDAVTALMLPWRGLLPNGRNITFDAPRAIPYFGMMDRTAFRDSAKVTLVRGDDHRPHLLIAATLDRPVNQTTTISALAEPVKVVGGRGAVTGDFRLDDDGVLHSGWLSTTGTLTTESGAARLVSQVTHETYIDMIAMSPFVTQ